MNQPSITERQQQWVDHIRATASYEGTIVAYAKANNLKTKDIYQWKTLLTKRGFLPMPKEQPMDEFIPVQPIDKAESIDSSSVSSRIP